MPPTRSKGRKHRTDVTPSRMGRTSFVNPKADLRQYMFANSKFQVPVTPQEEKIEVIDLPVICRENKEGQDPRLYTPPYFGCCWWDHHPINHPEGKSIGMPRSFDPLRKIYWVFGHFCSYSCALAYCLDDKACTFKNASSIIYRLYRKLYGKAMPPLRAAPHWSILKSHGGCLSIEEFRALNVDASTQYFVQDAEWRMIPRSLIAYKVTV